MFFTMTEDDYAKLKLEVLKPDPVYNAFRFDKNLEEHKSVNVWVADVAYSKQFGIIPCDQFPPSNIGQLGDALTVFDDGDSYYCIEPKHVRVKWVIKL